MTTHAAHDDPQAHMGLPLPTGKLAMWLFLVTEIMFFTGPIGAINTFVLICSSVTVVLAHYALGRGRTKRALQYVGATLALGATFLVIKAYEYYGKFQHDIIPGRMGETLPGISLPSERQYQ